MIKHAEVIYWKGRYNQNTEKYFQTSGSPKNTLQRPQKLTLTDETLNGVSESHSKIDTERLRGSGWSGPAEPGESLGTYFPASASCCSERR